MGQGSVSVVTVTFNSAHIVRTALSAFSPDVEVICVDNASSDDLDTALEGLNVRRINNPVNVGFGRACNQGLAAASGEFVLFINPDVVFEKDTLSALLDAAKRYPDCGVFLPLTRRPDGTLWLRNSAAGLRLQRKGRDDADQIAGDFCTQFLDGSVFMIRRSLFLEIGGFDENIFLYYEDDDFSRRLQAKKAPIIVVANANSSHAIGKSVPNSVNYNFNRNKHKKISEIYYKRKYNIRYSSSVDFVNHLLKVVVYAVTLDRMRLAGALGRLVGVFSHITKR
ncbi:glycosyltransferase family 2 protein [Kaistia dalseonensis]|uniref:GT2 family glycosyltransferase n=1 Tax=Kaistia dalseonensis TaxID=410840 RepID=A0ABU0H9X7_9HYPH|nr:glycosyltransferase family 2 protein [Kaistia dalseonensis]MCX5495672.1 glycosyltransferase family 2 protein [Kaistia dalseonensis]MDQ0438266.1 GT2 family glycosyltransferase [Kaistia dalseonensis]